MVINKQLIMSKFKVGDRVRVKSKEWYDRNKDEDGIIDFSDGSVFIFAMYDWLGCVVTIAEARPNGRYCVEECGYTFTDEMLEDEVEKESETAKTKFKVGDSVKVKPKKWYEANKDIFGDISNGVSTLPFISEMKPLLGQIVKIKSINSSGHYYIENSNFRIADYMLEDYVLGTDKPEETVLKELIPDNKNNIDWEQRRYELAKAAMQAFANSKPNVFINTSAYATCCKSIADEMIKQLKNS